MVEFEEAFKADFGRQPADPLTTPCDESLAGATWQGSARYFLETTD